MGYVFVYWYIVLDNSSDWAINGINLQTHLTTQVSGSDIEAPSTQTTTISNVNDNFIMDLQVSLLFYPLFVVIKLSLKYEFNGYLKGNKIQMKK